MGLAIIQSRACVGIAAPPVSVEVHISNGLPAFNLVGLAETTVKEARDRVRSAIINSGFEFPAKRITVNLAPADLPKEGGRFDLPIALGIIVASNQLHSAILQDHEFIGELALSGELRAVKGALSAAITTRHAHKMLIIPQANLEQVALLSDSSHLAATDLNSVCSYLAQKTQLLSCQIAPQEAVSESALCLQDIIGQQQGKRALEIAAAGGHNLLLLGPPGTGKTMLAMRLSGLLPPMNDDEAQQTASIYSLTDTILPHNNWRTRPFRMPHHSSSLAALIGGGSIPKPGEISLAHNGVLFLDELPEFERRALDALRQPIESGEIVISRSRSKINFPAKFQLIGALNPCITGYTQGPLARQSTPQAALRYLSKLSGPFLDRFDLAVDMPLLAKGVLSAPRLEDRGASSEMVRQRVVRARLRMLTRAGKLNSELSSQELSHLLTIKEAQFLENAIHQLGLSVRAYHRLIKVARTIADLNEEENIQHPHLVEALSYRAMDNLLKQLMMQIS